MAGFLDQLGQTYLETEPTAAFYSAFPLAGGTSALAQFIRQAFPRYYGGYQAAVAGNPALTFPSYLQGFNPSGEFFNLAPRLRGEFPGLFAPRLRWLS